MQNHSNPAGADAIQDAGFFATALLEQLVEHLDEIAAAGSELGTDQSDQNIRRVRAQRINSLCDRGRDFIGLAQQQLELIERENQTNIRAEIDGAIAAEQAAGGQA